MLRVIGFQLIIDFSARVIGPIFKYQIVLEDGMFRLPRKVCNDLQRMLRNRSEERRPQATFVYFDFEHLMQQIEIIEDFIVLHILPTAKPSFIRLFQCFVSPRLFSLMCMIQRYGKLAYRHYYYKTRQTMYV